MDIDLIVAREVLFEESKITNSVNQENEITAEFICKRKDNGMLVCSSLVEEICDGIEGNEGGLEIFIHGVCIATHKNVVDVDGLVAMQLRHIHIYRRGGSRWNSRAGRDGRGDLRGSRSRVLDQRGP